MIFRNLFWVLLFTSLVSAQIKVACIGASIAVGGLAPVGYPVLLGSLLGSGYQVQNDGVNSCTMLKKGDISYWTSGKLPSVFALKPNIVTIELGGNDAKPQNWQYGPADFGPDMLAMVDTLENNITPKPLVYVCLTIPAWPVNGVNSYGIDGTVISAQEIPIMQQAITAHGLHFIDLHTPLLGLQSHFADGVHPDSLGEDSIAHIIYHILTAPTGIGTFPIPGLKKFDMRGNNLVIDFPDFASDRLEITDVAGKSRFVKGNSNAFSLSGIPPGIYWVRTSANNPSQVFSEIVVR